MMTNSKVFTFSFTVLIKVLLTVNRMFKGRLRRRQQQEQVLEAKKQPSYPELSKTDSARTRNSFHNWSMQWSGTKRKLWSYLTNLKRFAYKSYYCYQFTHLVVQTTSFNLLYYHLILAPWNEPFEWDEDTVCKRL